MGHSAAAAELGVAVSAISSLAWSQAMVDAGRYDTIPATSASVKKARNVEQNRWELIAARTGESVSRVKELFGGDDAAAASTVTRGSKKTTGNGDSAPKTSGRKSKTASAKAAPATRRARTRAERQAARSGNPS
jgi:hypothetical protein